MVTLARAKAVLFLVTSFAVAGLLLPMFSYAAQTAADLQCVGTAQCPVGMGPGPNGPCASQGGGTIGKACSDSTNGFTTPGVCVSTLPPKCQATSAPGLNGGNSLSSLSQLGQLLGQILGKLGQGSPGGSPGAPGTGTSCPSYTPTSDPTQVGVNPCVYYVPASTCVDPNASNYGATGSCSYNGLPASSATNTSAQDLLNSLTGGTNGNPSTGSGDTLTASPTSGPAPLSVSFSFIPKSTDVSPFTIDFGDGSSPQQLQQAACTNSVPPSCTDQATYSYASAGTYTANLTDANGATLASATISVVNPGGGTAPTDQSGLTQVFNTVGGLFTGSSSTPQSGQSFSNFPGVLGNILLDQNGATIFASTVNSANNSQTSGFYGSNTIGNQPQGIVSQMCQGRPWASNFLANVIPPTFFDSLCQWGGFQVGQQQQPAQQAQPQVTLTQKTGTAAQTQRPAAATSTTPSVPAQAIIWAVPASVPLGARTSVFWNTQGVTQCTESSPDGSFTENSLSGAAATVPITAATTFTISCLDQSGNPITDYVTVTLSN